MVTLTKDEQAVLAGLLTDPDELKFIRAFMRIPDKRRIDVPFNPWPVQERLIRDMVGRNVVVKDSQCGSTSIYTGVFAKRTFTQPNTTTVIMAHDEFTTGRLLHRAQVMYDSVPEQIKPRQDHSCLPYHVKVFTADGSQMRIGQIVSQRLPVDMGQVRGNLPEDLATRTLSY